MNDFLMGSGSRKYGIPFCLILFLIMPVSIMAGGEKVAAITVDPGSYERFNTPVFVEMYGFEPGTDRYLWEIYEITSGGKILKPSQIEEGGKISRLWWVLDGLTPSGTVRRFELVRRDRDTGKPASEVAFDDDGDKLWITCHGKRVLAYQHAIHPAPGGASDLYERSGFIHPLYSPAGAVLTRVNPPDHLHHMGLWNPWTKTEFEGRTIDFWNLKKGEGTVRFDHFISTESGAVFGGFRALQDHVDLSAPGGEKVALRELLEVRVWNIGEKAWLIDYTSSLNCATPDPFRIEKYRYQGFGFRATGAWDDANCHLITSGGFDKSNANATRARWCNIDGPSSSGRSGIVFMTYPANHNFPERLRIWPVGANDGKENVFFNFNPAQDEDWLLEPGKIYTLHYRMYIYDGKFQKDIPGRLWNDFAHPPKVEINKAITTK